MPDLHDARFDRLHADLKELRVLREGADARVLREVVVRRVPLAEIIGDKVRVADTRGEAVAVHINTAVGARVAVFHDGHIAAVIAQLSLTVRDIVAAAVERDVIDELAADLYLAEDLVAADDGELVIRACFIDIGALSRCGQLKRNRYGDDQCRDEDKAEDFFHIHTDLPSCEMT